MLGRSRSDSGTRITGPILFPVTLPLGVVRVAADSGLLSRKHRSEQFLAQPSPRLPRHEGITFGTASLLFHAAVLMTLVALGRASMAPTAISASDHAARTHPETPRLEVLLEPARHGGGGGGAATAHGGRSHAPKRRADAVTLPVATPIAPTTPPREVPPSQAVALDAKPLASGLVFQVRSLDGAPTLGTSQGPGSRGGVGEGVGTGPVLTLRGE